MHTRLIFSFSFVALRAFRTFAVGKVGHVTLESSSVLLLLALACGQKPQFAEHLPVLYVIRYAVVGSASIFPSIRPRTMAVPTETRTCAGSSVLFLRGVSGKGCTEIYVEK
jgi:hypothetical protein